MNTDGRITINEGDFVTIKALGTVRTGVVISAHYYGDDDGWYIELKDPTYGYCYYKQGYDGGTVELF
jgi:hypothetical protein